MPGDSIIQGAWAGRAVTTQRANSHAAATKNRATKREEQDRGEGCATRWRAGSLCLCIMSAVGSDGDEAETLASVWQENHERDSLKFLE